MVGVDEILGDGIAAPPSRRPLPVHAVGASSTRTTGPGQGQSAPRLAVGARSGSPGSRPGRRASGGASSPTCPDQGQALASSRPDDGAPPGVEGVVDWEPSSVALVVDLEQRKAVGDREEARRLRRRLDVLRDVGPVDHPGQQHEGRIAPQVVRLDEHLERAQAVTVRIPGAWCVEARRVLTFGVREHLSGRTWTISAAWSINLRISHGQAIRSVLGCSRVTHFTRRPSCRRRAGTAHDRIGGDGGESNSPSRTLRLGPATSVSDDFRQPVGRPSAGSRSAHLRVPRSGLTPDYVASSGLHLR